jgi:uncharacterized protein YcbX
MRLSKIQIFPIKSLDPIALSKVEITAGGALKGDREFAMFDQKGNYINAKRNPKIHLIRASYDLSDRIVNLQIQDQNQVFTFHLDRDRTALTNWFSEFFGQNKSLKEKHLFGGEFNR